MALDAALLALAARELKQTLLDAKIDKIFEPTRDEVVITLRTRTDTFKLLLSARSGSARACLTQDTFENPAVQVEFREIGGKGSNLPMLFETIVEATAVSAFRL